MDVIKNLSGADEKTVDYFIDTKVEIGRAHV